MTSDAPSGRRVPPGTRASLRQVAAAAGVSLSSASRALSNQPDVGPELRARVRAAATELGYERNLLWSGLREGSTATIGFVLRDIASPLLSEISLGAELALQARGYSMLVTNSQGDPRRDVQHIKLLDQRRVDGLLVQPSKVDDKETLETLLRLRVPFVAVDRDLPSSIGGGAVLIDHEAAMKNAARYLLDLGHRRIALVAPPRETRPGRVLADTLASECEQRGAEALIAEAPFSGDRVRAATTYVLSGPDRPTAIIAGSNQMTAGVLSTLREMGLRIKSDVSVLAFDDLPLLTCVDPAISVVSKYPIRVGETAANLLADMIAGAATPATVITPTELIVRESCGPPTLS